MVPDFDDTMNKVWSRSMRSSRPTTADGWVESRTCSRGRSSRFEKTAWKTSGARLDPPMPSTTASVTPSPATCDANDSRSERYSRMRYGRVSQPSLSTSSGCASSNHSDGSFAHSRWAKPSRSHTSSLRRTASSCLPRWSVTERVTSPATSSSLPASRASHRANRRTLPPLRSEAPP